MEYILSRYTKLQQGIIMVKIKKVKIEISGKTIDLTLDECKQLKSELDKLVEKEYKYLPWYPKYEKCEQYPWKYWVTREVNPYT